MGYLLESEIPTYTKIPGITVNDVSIASSLIDSYRGQGFSPKTYTNETVKLTRKRQYGQEVYKGKLLHLPRVLITSVTADIPSYFGGTTTQVYDVSCLSFDSDDYEYFVFAPNLAANHSLFLQSPPDVIKVTYSAGYSVIPEQLKVACGMICDSAKQNGGYRSFKSRQDFDMTIAFSDKEDPVMSSNILRLINMVRLT